MKVAIPTSFQNELFYKDSNFIHMENHNEHVTKIVPFQYDILFSVGEEAEKPWENIHLWLPKVWGAWKLEEGYIRNLYKTKNFADIKGIMIKYIALFTSSLFWLNQCPVTSLYTINEDSSGFLWKPVNVEERLQYIMDHPTQYHAFIQLNELFIEMEKLFYKKSIKIKPVKNDVK